MGQACWGPGVPSACGRVSNFVVIVGAYNTVASTCPTRPCLCDAHPRMHASFLAPAGSNFRLSLRAPGAESSVSACHLTVVSTITLTKDLVWKHIDTYYCAASFA